MACGILPAQNSRSTVHIVVALVPELGDRIVGRFTRSALIHFFKDSLMAQIGRVFIFPLIALATASVVFAAQQTATTDLRLRSAATGPGGTVVNGRFVLSEERGAFSKMDEKEMVASFEWEGTPGVHRMVATWRGPDGTVSSSPPVEYPAKDRRFGAYWRFALSPTMATGNWSVDVAVDGQPGGRLAFEVKGEPVPTVARKRVLTQAQLFDALNAVHVILQRSTSTGRGLQPAAAMVGSNGVAVVMMAPGHRPRNN